MSAIISIAIVASMYWYFMYTFGMCNSGNSSSSSGSGRSSQLCTRYALRLLNCSQQQQPMYNILCVMYAMYRLYCNVRTETNGVVEYVVQVHA